MTETPKSKNENNAKAEKKPWKGGPWSLLIALAMPFVIAVVEIFWLGPPLLHALGATQTPDSARGALFALIVGTGVFIALVGAMLRTVAHGRIGRHSKNFDLTGKVLAVAAGVLALVGAVQFFTPVITPALPFVTWGAVALLGVLIVLYGIYWLVLERLTRPRPTQAQTRTNRPS